MSNHLDQHEGLAKQAVTVRLSSNLYAALQEAGAVRGLTQMSDILRAAALDYVAHAAVDNRPLRDLEERQRQLQDRAEELRQDPAHAHLATPAGRRTGG